MAVMDDIVNLTSKTDYNIMEKVIFLGFVMFYWLPWAFGLYVIGKYLWALL